jgi:carbonic anhydrase/acetyltransferase-like protein (isoleucine patch superfamily)
MLHSFDGHEPDVAEGAYVAPSADLIGRVLVETGACVLFSAVLRGDTERIAVGAGSNVQDGVVIHADPGFPATIGTGVSIGHNATIHGCQIDNDCLIGMSATIMNGATIGRESLVAAGAVVLEGTVIPRRSLVAGVPAKVIRELSDDDVVAIRRNAEHYQEKTTQYLAG